MAGPIPALGYPSRTDAALALLDARKAILEIAAALGVEPKNVHALIESAARRAIRGCRPR